MTKEVIRRERDKQALTSELIDRYDDAYDDAYDDDSDNSSHKLMMPV